MAALPRVMTAVRVHQFGGADVLKIENAVPLPQLQNKQVLVKIKSAAVNPYDTYIRAGTYTSSLLPKLPYTPGSDSAGVIVARGAGVQSLKVGDRVYTALKHVTGSYAQYAAVEETGVFLLDPRLTFQQGAALGIPYYTAYRALVIKGNIRAGQRVLVHGASGAVGIASLQIAKSYGCEVFGTAGTSEGLQLVKNNGAAHVFNHREKNYLQDIRAATNDAGVDLIIEMLANKNLAHDLELLAPGGRVMIVGSRGNIEISPRDLMTKETRAIGIALGTSTEAEWKETAAAVNGGITSGWINPVIDKEYTLEDVAKAHHDIIESSGAKGKILLTIPHNES